MARFRRVFVLLIAAGVALTVGVGVWAYLSSIGSGQASATVATLQTASITSATPGAGTVSLQWSAITPPAPDTVSYYVTRDGGAPAGGCPTSSTPSSATSCIDSGLGVGTHQYTVTALWRTWTSTSSTTSANVTYGPIDHFRLTAATTMPTAGAGDNLTITAQDASNNTVGNYTGSQQLTFAGASTIGSYTPTVVDSSGTAVAFGSTTAITFTNGVATVSSGKNGVMALHKVETATIFVSDGSHTNGGLTVTVNAAAAASFSLSAVVTVLTAGGGVNLTVTAKDSYGNVATGYAGSKNLVFAGAATIGTFRPTVTNRLGAAINFGSTTSTTFTAGVATVSGTSNGVMTLYKVEAPSITVTAGAISNGAGLAVTVGPASAARFSVPTPVTQTAGSAFNETLTAQDLYGNTATSYSGSQTVTFTGPGNAPDGTAPAYPGLVTFAAGVGTGSVTLYAAQSTTLTATQAAISGSSGSFTVSPASAHHFAVPTPATQTANAAFNETLTAQDQWNNTATSYVGSQSVTFTGPDNAPDGTAPIYPATVTFAAGAGTASITLYNAQTTTLTATQATITGTSNNFTVNAAAAASFSLSAVVTVLTAGGGVNLTVTAKDSYGNVATGYAGSKNLVFAGAATIGTFRPTVTNRLGAAINFGSTTSTTFTAGVATVSGTSNGVMTLYKVEAPSITVTAGAISNGAGLAVTVGPASAARFSVPTPVTQTAGSAFNETLTAQDLYGNTATSYSGSQTVTFTGPGNAPDGTAPAYPGLVTFAAGVGTGSVTLYAAQSTTLTATQAAISGSSGSFTVSPASAHHFAVPTPATPKAGTAFNEKLAAQDQWNNTATSYVGSQSVTFTGPDNAPDGTAPIYPATVTFAAGAGTASITLYNAQTTTLTATQATITGTSNNFTVNAAAASRLAWTSSSVSGGSLQANCLFTCSWSGANNKTFTFRVSVTDSRGNIVQNLGSSPTITITGSHGTPASQTGSISSSGAATTGGGPMTFTLNNGGWTTDTLTASATGYTHAVINITS